MQSSKSRQPTQKPVRGDLMTDHEHEYAIAIERMRNGPWLAFFDCVVADCNKRVSHYVTCNCFVGASRVRNRPLRITKDFASLCNCEDLKSKVIVNSHIYF